MMKNIKIILLLFVLLLLTACSINRNDFAYNDVIENVKKPNNNQLLIEGSFSTKEMIALTEVSDDILKKYESKPELYVSKDFIKFGDMYSFNPNFKSRFLNYKNLISMSGLLMSDKIDAEEGPVLTVSDGQFYYQNILVLDDNKVAVINDGILFIMEKYSDTIDNEIVEKAFEKDMKEDETNADELQYAGESAVFIGLKTPKKDSLDNTYYEYKTIMVQRDENMNLLVYGIKDLFVPGKNGINISGVDHIVEGQKARDVFFYNPINNKDKKENQKIQIGEGSSNSILYIGNGYLSIETKDYDSAYRKYRLYDLQKLDSQDALNVKDIAGEDGLKSFIEDTAKTINKNNIGAKAIELTDTYCIGMVRNKGSWEYKSNLIIDEEDRLLVIDYFLNIVPTIQITNDNLSLSYEDIKTKIPNMIDAYTSPNGDLLIVHKPQEIMAYNINNGIISNEPELSINVGEYEKIVMTEWLTGSLVEDWSNVFLKQQRVPIHTIE